MQVRAFVQDGDLKVRKYFRYFRDCRFNLFMWVDEHGHMLNLNVNLHTGFSFFFFPPSLLDIIWLQHTKFRVLACISMCETCSSTSLSWLNLFSC